VILTGLGKGGVAVKSKGGVMGGEGDVGIFCLFVRFLFYRRFII